MNTLSSISFVTRTAFSNPLYLIIASIAGVVFWIVTNTFDNILFFSPFLTFYVPNDMLGVFFLSCINSILVAVLVNFNLHIIRDLKLRISKSAVAVPQSVLSPVLVQVVPLSGSFLLQRLVDWLL